MRVALLAMPELSPWIRGESWHIPNLAICNIAGNTPEPHHVRAFDLNRRRRNVRGAVEKILKRFKPDIIGMSSMTFQYETARAVAWMARQHDPGIVTVLGGYHASMMYREIAESWDRNLFDWLIRGEGDFAIAEIIEVLEGRREPSDVPGASYKDNGRFVHTDDRPLQDLSRAQPARTPQASLHRCSPSHLARRRVRDLTRLHPRVQLLLDSHDVRQEPPLLPIDYVTARPAADVASHGQGGVLLRRQHDQRSRSPRRSLRRDDRQPQEALHRHPHHHPSHLRRHRRVAARREQDGQGRLHEGVSGHRERVDQDAPRDQEGRHRGAHAHRGSHGCTKQASALWAAASPASRTTT